MTASNPYNCTQAGNLFVGYQHERQKIVRGLRGGKSFAMVGGRRCGKTSLLLQLQDDLLPRAGADLMMLPRLVDMHAVVPRNPQDFFRALESAVTKGLGIKPWNPSPSEQAYQAFLARMKEVDGQLQDAYGPSWTVVLLLDELDAAAKALGNDECFQNLRNLLSADDRRHRFRVICAGVNSLVGLIEHGSPLNILEKVHVRALSSTEAGALAQHALAGGPSPDAVRGALRLAGGHAYVLQALLSYLWDLPAEPQSLQLASTRFVKDRADVLRRWVRDIGESGRAVYEALLSAGERPLREAELRRLLSGSQRGGASDGLCALSFHGLIDDALDPPRISCELFRDWYLSEKPGSDEPEPSEGVTNRKRVFVVSGRNRKAHAATCTFLRSLGLDPLEWSRVVNMTGEATPSAMDVLDKAFELSGAVVVLFTPDDEARLAAGLLRPLDSDYEKELRAQPRANVLVEAGMALSRFKAKTVFVQVGQIRPISDLAGLQFVRMDNSHDARQNLKERLETAGCVVDRDTTAWHTAGDFSLRTGDQASSLIEGPVRVFQSSPPDPQAGGFPVDVTDLLTRFIDIQMISPGFLARIREMLAACRTGGCDYYATSGYRSAAEQDKLYAQGRTAPGNVVTNAKGFQSAHNFGIALDFTRDKDLSKAGLQPSWVEADYDVLGKEAAARGLVWGGSWKFKDRPHVQVPGYVSATELDPLRVAYQGATVQGADDKAKDISRLQAVWSWMDANPK